ncbi:MAG: hypothetical protein H6707_19370 [Deltaproteobacteria bacterium]|nr:hypothetical protein [Deltaproteobacteria bacterium]
MLKPTKAVLAFLTLLTTTANAAPSTATANGKTEGAARQLNGHTFIRSEFVAWPFITTHFGFTLGGGLLTSTGIGIDDNGDDFAGPIDNPVVGQSLNISIGLFDWVALRGSFTGLMWTGTDVDLILKGGAQFAYSLDGGVTVRILKLQSLMLSLGAGTTYAQQKYVAPGRALGALLKSGDFSAAKGGLFVDVKTLAFAPHLALAYAPLSFIGFQSSIGFNVGKAEVGDQSVTSKALEFAIGSSLDLQKAYIPLAFLVAYQLEKTLGDQSETQHQLEAGVYYSGRPNLDLGVAFSTLLGENEYKQYLGQLRLNYVW